MVQTISRRRRSHQGGVFSADGMTMHLAQMARRPTGAEQLALMAVDRQQSNKVERYRRPAADGKKLPSD